MERPITGNEQLDDAMERIAELEQERDRLLELIGEMLASYDQTHYFDSDKYRQRFIEIT